MPAAHPRLAPLRLSDRLAVLLGEQIDSGALRPGDRLPTEVQLATAHGVSRTVVREAVHQLKSRERVVSRQGSGVFVAVPPAHQPLAFDPTVLGSVQAVVHVVELRRVIEAEMAGFAAERATRGQLATMRRALKAIDKAAAAGQDGVAEDLAFHRAIGEATGNPQFTLLLAGRAGAVALPEQAVRRGQGDCVGIGLFRVLRLLWVRLPRATRTARDPAAGAASTPQRGRWRPWAIAVRMVSTTKAGSNSTCE